MKKYILLPIAALCLAACSTDDTAEQPVVGQTPICIKAVLDDGNTTRAYTSSAFRNNKIVYVWADMIDISTNAKTEYFNAWELRATNTAGQLQANSAVKFYPATNLLDMYAMAGTFSGYSLNAYNGLPTGGIYHTVSDNQTGEAAYYNSDLLYAQLKSQQPVEDETGVTMRFYHLLSKVRVVLIPGTGNTSINAYNNQVLRNATVKLLNVHTRVKFSPSKNVSMEDFATDPSVRAGMITLAPKNDNDAVDYNPQRDVTLATGVAAFDTNNDVTDDSYGDAIIVPQTFTVTPENEGKFIQVTLTDPVTNQTHDTYFRFANNFTFESGKQYQFILTLDRIGDTYSVTPTISSWTSEVENRAVDLKQPTN